MQIYLVIVGHYPWIEVYKLLSQVISCLNFRASSEGELDVLSSQFGERESKVEDAVKPSSLMSGRYRFLEKDTWHPSCLPGTRHCVFSFSRHLQQAGRGRVTLMERERLRGGTINQSQSAASNFQIRVSATLNWWKPHRFGQTECI